MTHVGLAFETRRVPLFTDTTDDELRPYFSDCKVPVLLHGDQVVWDTIAILEYLAERFPDCRAWPGDVAARAVARSVSAEMHSSFSHLREAMPMNCRAHCKGFAVSDAVRREVDRIEAIWERCHFMADSDGPYLFGEFSIADAMYAPVVFRFNTYDVALSDPARAYCRAMLDNPAMQFWKAAAKQESEVIDEEEVCD